MQDILISPMLLIAIVLAVMGQRDLSIELNSVFMTCRADLRW